MEELNRQLSAKNIILTEGRINIIDATPVEAAQSGLGKGKDGQPKRDRQAGWHVKEDSRGTLKSTHGYSVHMGVDEDGFIQRQTGTAGNVHDSVERDTLLLGMKPPFMRMRLTVRKRRATNWNVLTLQIRCNARATATSLCRQRIVNVMMRLRPSVLAVSGPLPLTKAAMA